MAEAPRHKSRRKQPQSVTFVIWGILLLGLANGWRAVGFYRQRNYLLELGVAMDPLIQMIVALAWMVAFCFASFALWRSHKVMRFVIPILLLIYAFYQLSILAFFAQTAESLNAWPISAGLYAAVILVVTWVLNRGVAREATS